MKELFKNKLFIIISFILFIFTIFSFSSVNATSENEIINFHSNEINQDFSIVLPSGLGVNYSKYFIVVEKTSSNNVPYRVNLFCANSSDFIFDFPTPSDESANAYINLIYNTNHDDRKYYYNFMKVGSNYYYDFSDKIVDWVSTTGLHSDYMFSGTYTNHSIFANNNIYNLSNEVVFQAPPHQVEEQETPQQIQQVTIPAIQQVEEIPQGMTQVLQVIIPIGLIVLSIGLVIYLMRLVIYRMQS